MFSRHFVKNKKRYLIGTAMTVCILGSLCAAFWVDIKISLWRRGLIDVIQWECLVAELDASVGTADTLNSSLIGLSSGWVKSHVDDIRSLDGSSLSGYQSHHANALQKGTLADGAEYLWLGDSAYVLIIDDSGIVIKILAIRG